MRNSSERRTGEPNRGARLAVISAALYGLWAILHLGAAWQVWQLAAQVDRGALQGRVEQDAWHLAMIALLAAWIAWTRNRVNDRQGFAANAVLVGLTDVGFILLLLLPGHVPPWPGAIGPSVWLGALVCGAVALRQSHRGIDRSSASDAGSPS